MTQEELRPVEQTEEASKTMREIHRYFLSLLLLHEKNIMEGSNSRQRSRERK